MLQDLSIARRSFSTAYENAEVIPDEAFRTYLEPVLATEEAIAKMVRFAGECERDRAQIKSVAPQLRSLRVPAQVKWGDADAFFDIKSVDWLRENIPGLKSIIVPRARLFFPEEHPRLMSVLLRQFWRSVA
jgi:pimeloyl-ACP methyl ester carboxylesterase